MDYGDYFEFYQTHLGLKNENITKLLAENTTFRHRKKGERLVRAGDKTRTVIFLLKGVGRVYVIDDEGHEVVMGFCHIKGEPCPNIASLQQRHTVNVDAITDMDTLELPIPIITYAVKKDPDCLEVYHEKMVENHNTTYEWQVARQTKKGKDRYKWFAEKYRDIIGVVQQKDVASYLGIQPPSLSRIKAQIKQENM